MKKELKRYYLVEYYGERNTKLDTLDEVKEMIHKIKNYNNRKTSKFLLGNVQVEHIDNGYSLKAHIYRKFTEKSKISDIDDLTSKYTEKELIKLYEEKSKMADGALPDINIAYLETKDKDETGKVKYERGIKYIPVLYRDDLKYVDKTYIRQCLYFHCSIKDYDFFTDLANEFSVHHFVGDEISKLYDVIDKCRNQKLSLNELYKAADNLYTKFILEYERDESLSRDKNGKYIISRRRLRDFGFYIKNYNIRDSKIRSPYCYNLQLPTLDIIEEESGQLRLVLK